MKYQGTCSVHLISSFHDRLLLQQCLLEQAQVYHHNPAWILYHQDALTELLHLLELLLRESFCQHRNIELLDGTDWTPYLQLGNLHDMPLQYHHQSLPLGYRYTDKPLMHHLYTMQWIWHWLWLHDLCLYQVRMHQRLCFLQGQACEL